MKREPTEGEYEKVRDAIFGGDRIEAIMIYSSIKQCGLTEAQDFIRSLTAELKETNPARFIRKKQGKSHWVRPSIP
jgi:ribosomal protein L7/L12